MISKKLRIMKRLAAHLAGMTPAWQITLPDDWDVEDTDVLDGLAACPFDLTNKVFRGRTVFGDDIDAPFLSILEAPRQFNPNDAGDAKLTQNEVWTLLIQGFANEDIKHPTDPAYALLAWTQARMAMITATRGSGARGGLYPEAYQLGGYVESIGYQIPVVRPGKDDVSDTAYFYMPVAIGVVTNLAQPFVEGA